jgi:hypothetical protein
VGAVRAWSLTRYFTDREYCECRGSIDVIDQRLWRAFAVR